MLEKSEPRIEVRTDAGTRAWDEVAPIEVGRGDAASLLRLCMPGASFDERAAVEPSLRHGLGDGFSKLHDALARLCEQEGFVAYKAERLRHQAQGHGVTGLPGLHQGALPP